jgi:hypothetical protein
MGLRGDRWTFNKNRYHTKKILIVPLKATIFEKLACTI